MKLRWLLGVGLALVVGLSFAAAQARPVVWTVRSATTTMILFGSIHLLPPGLDWRPAALDEALAKADEVWFELPITAKSDNEANVAVVSRGALPGDGHLFDMLTPDEAEKLRRVAAMLHCQTEAIDRMQPWMADFTLSVAEDASGGADAFNGVEEQVQAIAPLAVKRRAFETAKQQIDFLAGAPVKDQIASLEWTLSEIDDDPASYRRVVDEWMAGDLDSLRHDAVEPLRAVSPTLYERLIADRNRAWAKALGDRMKHRGLIVVVVGIGHMIGPDGLPALLQARGLKVEAVEAPTPPDAAH